jgi:hypothetical protein
MKAYGRIRKRLTKDSCEFCGFKSKKLWGGLDLDHGRWVTHRLDKPPTSNHESHEK